MKMNSGDMREITITLRLDPASVQRLWKISAFND
jgi:hypothetical protein